MPRRDTDAADMRGGSLGDPRHPCGAPKGAAALRVEFARMTEPSPVLAQAWDTLAARAAEPNVFAERWFFMAALRHLDTPGTAHMLTVWRDHGDGGEAELITLMPLTVAPQYGRIPVPQVTNWRHYQAFLGTPLIAAGHEVEAWHALLDALSGAKWARNFLHWEGLVENGPVHRGLVAASGGRCATVHRVERAFLESRLSPEAYYEQTVRKKKRKEIKRLSARLNELGAVTTRHLGADEPLEPWLDMFLALEQSGWKGHHGAALANTPQTAAFFRETLSGARAAGKLAMLRLDLDGKPLAMLVNFLSAPGSFSFKIAFDEDYARYSPGVLIQIENYAILSQPGIAWMDSCAVENHPMINTMWAQRRPIIRVTVPFATLRSRVVFRLCRCAEQAAAWVRRMKWRNKRHGSGAAHDNG
jgi:CelD/BcsL family acetyltransferase involved in cellulose biosynthesis